MYGVMRYGPQVQIMLEHLR